MSVGLKPRQRRALRAVAEAVFYRPTDPVPAERIDWLVDDVSDLLARVGGRPRSLLKAMLLLVSVVGALMALRPWPFRHAPLEKRVAVLQRMEAGFLSAPLLALKAVLCMVWYEHPESAREIGYDGVAVAELPA